MSRESEALRLRTIADELASLASALFPERDETPDPVPAKPDLGEYVQFSEDEQQRQVELARRLYFGRRLRPRIFEDEALFGEPAWDILLDLFIAEAEGKTLSVTAACIGAAVPTSTALRWLAILETRGYVRRENDTTDARRVFLRLTSVGYTKMTNYFQFLQREGVLEDLHF